MADWTGKARKTVADRLADLAPIDANNRNAFYDSREALPILYGVDDERKGRLDLQQERAKLAKEQTSRVNLDVRRLEGELLHRDDILESWTRAYALFKAHLRAMPQRIAQTAIAATDLKDIEREARKEIDAALAELSSGTVIRSGLDTKAASRTERSRLGRVQPPTVA